MGFDLRIGDDGDYIDDGAGAFELTRSAQPSLRHQVLDQLGAWAGDPEAGRELVPLNQRFNTEAEANNEADTVRTALRPLILEGVIRDLQITTDRDQFGRWQISVSCEDAQSGERLALDLGDNFGG